MVQSTPSFTSESLAALKKRYVDAGQGHVFHYFDELSDEAAAEFFAQLSNIDIEKCNEFFDRTVRSPAPVESSSAKIEPLASGTFGSTLGSSNASSHEEWRAKGIELIRQNKVAVILLAGGQGTRLGSSEPKGCYDIGLPSHKCLFEIQAERIRRLQQIVSAGSDTKVVIPWLVMTSGPTSAATQKKFADSNYFGLDADNIFFFNQGVLPCFGFDGKVILESPSKAAVAPDGNGGIYEALRISGALDWLKERGVEHIHSYCVDNCLVRVADPVFIGYAALQGAECGALVVPKKSWDEPVGVICMRNGKYGVVEYSEISQDMAKMTRDGTDELAYNAGNICNHYYTLDFLRERVPDIEAKLEHHIAKKKIKCIDIENNAAKVVPTKPNGIKLERFVFDVFPYVQRMAILEVDRRDQFSPLKNAPGAGVDCAETSRHDLIAQHIRFAEAAGAKVEAAEGQEPSFEISPLVSYAGEGLESLNGKTLAADQLISDINSIILA